MNKEYLDNIGIRVNRGEESEEIYYNTGKCWLCVGTGIARDSLVPSGYPCTECSGGTGRTQPSDQAPAWDSFEADDRREAGFGIFNDGADYSEPFGGTEAYDGGGWPGDGSGTDDFADYNQNEADDYYNE